MAKHRPGKDEPFCEAITRGKYANCAEGTASSVQQANGKGIMVGLEGDGKWKGELSKPTIGPRWPMGPGNDNVSGFQQAGMKTRRSLRG